MVDSLSDGNPQTARWIEENMLYKDALMMQARKIYRSYLEDTDA